MKKILLSTLLLIILSAIIVNKTYACAPPYNNNGCPNINNPDFNFYGVYSNIIAIITGQASDYQRQTFQHAIDNRAPQLTGLIRDITHPAITNIYYVQGVPNPGFSDLPSNYAPLAGFQASPGQVIQVPPSGYDLGAGYEAQILYADTHSITLNYTREGTPAVGYTMHIGNINTNPEILALYNQSQNGLVSLSAFQEIGTATGEVLVAIRDTGSLMDPRWAEWWLLIYDPTDPSIPQIAEPGTQPITETTCTSIENQGPFRPNAYSNICKKPGYVPNPTKSYATTFTVSTHKEFHIDDIEDESKTLRCNGLYYPLYDWNATISEDYSKTELPWVGFGRSTEETVAESKYLADYLEGTIYYDSSMAQPENFWSKAGVSRKLLPEWYQDKLKCELIKNSKGDYPITIEYYKFEIPNTDPIIITKTKNLKSIICPPIDIVERANTWDYTEDFYFWPAVPMFTHEDTPGSVTLTAQNPPGELTGITEGFNDEAINKVSHTLSIPHVKRDFELSKTIYNLLLPSGLQNPSTISENILQEKPTIIASPKTTNTNELPKDNLLAVAAGPTGGTTTCAPGLNLYQSSNPDGTYTYSFKETLINDCYYRDTTVNVQYFCNGNQTGGCSEFYRVITHNDPNDPNNHPLNFACQPTSCNDNLTATVSWSGGVMGGSQDYCGNSTAQNSSCSCTTSTTNGNTATTCLTLPPAEPPRPVCGNLGLRVGDRYIDGKLDPKDPDKLDNVSPSERVQNLNNRQAVPDDPMREAAVSEMRRECDECEGRIPSRNCHDKCNQTFHYSTEISSELKLPYLEKIQKNTAKDDKTGFLNLIRPGILSGFKEADSKSNIDYAASGDEVEISPSSGYVEFPYLQGVYDAQACVSQRLLLPANFAANVPCPISAIP